MTSFTERRRQLLRDKELRLAFARTFRASQDVEAMSLPVLAFLKSFCHATASTIFYDKNGAVDPLASAAAQGRQEVWHQIRAYLELDDADLTAMDRWLKQNEEGIRKDVG